MRDPSQWAAAVRVVAMCTPSSDGTVKPNLGAPPTTATGGTKGPVGARAARTGWEDEAGARRSAPSRRGEERTMLVRELVTREVVSVRDASALDAAVRVLAEHHVSALP